MPADKIKLTDDVVRRLPFAPSGNYIVRDSDVKNFFLLVGKRRKTYCVQQDIKLSDVRRTVRVRIGVADQITATEARGKARKTLAGITDSVIISAADKRAVDRGENPIETRKTGVTLQLAWERYKEAMLRKNRAARTIEGYEAHLDLYFADWKRMPLRLLANEPDMVARRHDLLTATRGRYAANGGMRTLRAIYNHARKKDRGLPAGNPVDAVDWHREARRNTGMGPRQLPRWFDELYMLDNVLRREFHLFTLLSGCRPGALKRVEIEHIDWRSRLLHIPRPKGGTDRAFDIPLSPPMIRCLIRAIRISRTWYPEQAERWVFAAESASGHLEEHQEDRAVLSKWANDLRQTFRTCAQAARVPSLDAKILMNHALPGVNEEYITVAAIMSDHLRRQQEKISDIVIGAVRAGRGEHSAAIIAWIGSGRTTDGRVDLQKPFVRRQRRERVIAEENSSYLWLCGDAA
jgi:integrase